MAGLKRTNSPSEFGGEPGRVARPGLGHPFGPENGVTHEFARLERNTDPMEPSDTAEAALTRELRREGRA